MASLDHAYKVRKIKYFLLIDIFIVVLNRKISTSDTSLEYSSYVDDLKELEETINEISTLQKKLKNFELFNTQMKFLYDFINDDKFVSILENLNLFSMEVSSLY
jgi:hypothetical protein